MMKTREHKFLCLQRIQLATDRDAGYCNMTWDNIMCWESVPAGTVAKQPCPDYINRFNRAAYATRECQLNGTWKSNAEMNNTDGWTNYSQCLAGVTAAPDLSAHMSRIQLMSDIGYGISLAALIIAVLIMVISKRLHCKSNSLHINLFLAFILRASVSFLKNILFVEGVGLEKDIVREPGNKMITFKEGASHWECKLLVTILIYSVGASLMWIFMEGLYLHMLVYRTLFTERHGVRLYFVIGWFSPLIYILPWVLVRVYLDDDLCWNTYKDNSYVWIIKAPIILTVLVNFVFFIDIVRVLCVRVRSHRHPKGSSKHLRKIAKFALVLIPLFGVIYIGFAAYPHGLNVKADMVYLYCEMFYNSIQGFILALLFCFLNEEVHNEIRRYWYRRRFSGFGTRSVFLSSWRKTSNASRGTMSTAGNLNDRNLISDADTTTAVGKAPQPAAEKRQVFVNYKRGTHDSKDDYYPMNSDVNVVNDQTEQMGCELYMVKTNSNSVM